MKKWYTLVLVSSLFVGQAFAAASPVNQYKTEKRPAAPEPTPQQYTISVTDAATVTKPPFSYYTQFNPSKPKEYSIPLFDDANQLPKIGKWMIAIETGQKTVTYVPAHWLDDLSANGQYIIEPINYIFVVYKNNADDAIKTLDQALVKSGFNTKWSGAKYHSDNYHAVIGNETTSQLKRKDGIFLTFSNNFWLHQNDHLRVMGPYKTVINNQPAFIFVSSVSEESVWDEKLYAGHFFVSFAHARNNLATALIETGYPTYYVLSNNILNTAKESTEDHDGKLFVTVFK